MFMAQLSVLQLELESMLAWLHRHRGKLALLGAAVAGSYLGGRWLLQKAGELQQKRQSSELESTRLQRHYQNNYQMCLTAVLDLLPRLKEVVKAELNAETITAELRAKPVSKVTLWENLKIISFARLVVSVYLCSALTVLLRVQLSVFGGSLFLQQQGQDQTGEGTADVQKQCLATVQHLLGDGLLQLVQRVREATERVLVSYSLKHQLTSEGVGQLVSDVRAVTASAGRRPSPSTETSRMNSFLVQYLLPKEPLLEARADVPLLTAATRDVVESVEFSMVLEGVVDQAFAYLSSQVTQTYHSAAQSAPTLPVARVIPLITDLFEVPFSLHHSALVQDLFTNSELQKLSQRLFEAFSKPGEVALD